MLNFLTPSGVFLDNLMAIVSVVWLLVMRFNTKLIRI